MNASLNPTRPHALGAATPFLGAIANGIELKDAIDKMKDPATGKLTSSQLNLLSSLSSTAGAVLGLASVIAQIYESYGKGG